MSKRRYRKVLWSLDESLIKPLKGSQQNKIEQMYDNLWSQFGLDEATRRRKAERCRKDGKDMPCVSNWAWTEEAKEAFYAHDAHKKFVRSLKRMRGLLWGMWVLQSEPSDYTKPRQG